MQPLSKKIMRIQSKNVWLRDAFREAQIQMENGKIVNIEEYNSKEPDMDYGECYILPGFIDAHTHGHAGVDTTTADVEQMALWQREIAKEGVTSFMATTATESEADNLETFQRLSGAVGKNDGAEVLGIYMEGNFINPECKGAHDEKLISKPNVEQLKKYIDASEHQIRRMILAVELDDNFEVLKYALSQGIRVSIGHSAAPYETARKAIELGADALTHTYNGMKPFHHREPSLVGIAYTIDDIYTEIIGDGHHVSWPAVRALCRAKDEKHLVLVSDASPLKGYQGQLPKGIHIDERGQFRTDSGALCSSSLRINEGIYNLIHYAGTSYIQAINAATINPAKMLGVEDRKGSIQIGKDADFAVTDANFQMVQCYCKGKKMLKE